MKPYKYRSLHNIEHALDIIINQRLYCSEYTKLNDPFEGLFREIIPNFIPSGLTVRPLGDELSYSEKIKRYDDLIMATDHKRICSLSSDLNDVKLWSHYAQSHTGIAIELDLPDSDVVEVEYHDNIKTVGIGLLALGQSAKELFAHKTNHWDYESEYRIVTDQEYYDINGKIKRIYCGVALSPLHEEILSDLTRKYGFDLYCTELDANQVQIKPGFKINY